MDKAEAKKLINEIKTILNEWDFIGVLPDEGGPDDEYDCLHGEIVHLIETKADRNTIKSFLVQELKNHFGLGQNYYSEQRLETALSRIIDLEAKY